MEEVLTVYTGNGCAGCVEVKRYLKQEGYKIQERNVHTDQDAMDFLVNSGLRGVPHIFNIAGKWVGDGNNYKHFGNVS